MPISCAIVSRVSVACSVVLLGFQIGSRVGVAVAAAQGQLNAGAVSWQLARPVFVMPAFSLSALVSLALPLFIVTMASQILPNVLNPIFVLATLDGRGMDVMTVDLAVPPGERRFRTHSTFGSSWQRPFVQPVMTRLEAIDNKLDDRLNSIDRELELVRMTRLRVAHERPHAPQFDTLLVTSTHSPPHAI